MSVIVRMVFSLLFFCLPNAFGQELMLDWKPEPEFGGFYEALQKGFYSQSGLTVSILPGGAGQPVAQMVAAKKVKFGIDSGSDVILARNQGAKIVALFAVFQESPQGVMVHAERNVKSLKELFQSKGTIAIQKGYPYAKWLEKQYAPFQAKLVPYTGGIASFLKDPEFSQQCFVTSEPIAARREKQRVKTFLISEAGYNPYQAVVIAHEDTLKNEPQMVKAFLEATQKGWEFYLKDPKAANQAMQKLNPSLDLETFNQVSDVQKPLIETTETKKQGLGFMSEERWKKLYQQLVELKLVKPGMSASQFFQKR